MDAFKTAGQAPLAGKQKLSGFSEDHLAMSTEPNELNAIQDGMVINAASAQPFSAEPVNKESFDAVELSLRQKLPDLVKTHGPNMVNGMFTAPTDDSRGMFDFDK